MGFPIHTIEVPKGATPVLNDRIVLANFPSTANGTAAVGVAVNVVFSGLSLPAKYSVQAEASQPCWVSVGSKTQSGFTVTLTPTSGSVAIAAGTIDVTVIA